jgi:hypothetical protein
MVQMGMLKPNPNYDSTTAEGRDLAQEVPRTLYDVIQDKLQISRPITGYDGNQCADIVMRQEEWLAEIADHPLGRLIVSKWRYLHDILHITVCQDARRQLPDLKTAVAGYTSVMRTYFAAGIERPTKKDAADITVRGGAVHAPPSGSKLQLKYTGYARKDGIAVAAAVTATKARAAATTASEAAIAAADATAEAALALVTAEATVTARATLALATAAAVTARAEAIEAAEVAEREATVMLAVAHKAVVEKFPIIECKWKVYDHFTTCHVVAQIEEVGNLLAGSSWFVEAGNAAWKMTLRRHTSRGGGRTEDAKNPLWQAFKRMWNITHPSIRQHSAANKELK